MLETSQFIQEKSQQFNFMAAQCSSVNQYVLKPYALGFLGTLMYGYATVSYNQTLYHLKFRTAITVVTTSVLKVKIVLGK